MTSREHKLWIYCNSYKKTTFFSSIEILFKYFALTESLIISVYCMIQSDLSIFFFRYVSDVENLLFYFWDRLHGRHGSKRQFKLHLSQFSSSLKSALSAHVSIVHTHGLKSLNFYCDRRYKISQKYKGRQKQNNKNFKKKGSLNENGVEKKK